MSKDDNDSRESEGGLLEAILAWQPDSVPLEQLEGAREFAGDDPEKVEDVRLIERILVKYRKSAIPPGGGSQDAQPG